MMTPDTVTAAVETVCASCEQPFTLADVLTLSHGADRHKLVVRGRENR
jgi:hypothetical protein